ncbi:MAG: Na+/H+ antiporter NhaA type [uncultured Campylobacterales bacterium]|uniref:Na(+)/H(+) antiporter NhaA n=1 Tax=uncultured Campylobacterales bacterium TaxID=352960 RepID=A0A6S6S8G7_9BACT|nr:MAG: Na+/H+ antiporter NhaA type [uncultured Campylobacterales bacterium]
MNFYRMNLYKNPVVSNFFKFESAGGILLIVFAMLALIFANSPLKEYYHTLFDSHFTIAFGEFSLSKPFLLWVNDGLMAIFFFLVGLELKREIVEGELNGLKKAMLPAIGAIGGMVVPALIYVALNYDDPSALHGWAIPAATDIAFALGILALLGSRVPVSVKIFLTSLAIFDDIGAIVIIAIFYTHKISLMALGVSAICIGILWVLNRLNISERTMYVFVGLIMWVALLKSGVHATLAGVILALFIPMYSRAKPGYSPLKNMEHDLHKTVAFIILPIFAFANSGIYFGDMSVDDVFHTVPVGIALGLFFGKQIGIFVFCYLGVKFGLTHLPKGMNNKILYATAALCGIGFTMSLFISGLAFSNDISFDPRVGVMVGSLFSGIVGYVILNKVLPPKIEETETEAEVKE